MGYPDGIKFYSSSELFVLHYKATTDETKYNDDDEKYHELNLKIYIAVNMYIALL